MDDLMLSGIEHRPGRGRQTDTANIEVSDPCVRCVRILRLSTEGGSFRYEGRARE
jgi:hypothetical protein